MAIPEDTPKAEHGELQRQVLSLIGALGQCSVRDVHAQLSATRTISYNTVLTVMTRLFERDLLERTMQGRVGSFRLARSSDASAARHEVEQLMGRYGDIAVSQFVEQARLNAETFDSLRRLVSDEESDS